MIFQFLFLVAVATILMVVSIAAIKDRMYALGVVAFFVAAIAAATAAETTKTVDPTTAYNWAGAAAVAVALLAIVGSRVRPAFARGATTGNN